MVDVRVALSEENDRLIDENAKLARDYEVVRNAHDNLVSELDLRLVERKKLNARIAKLEAALRDLLRLVEEDPEEDDPSPYLFDQVCDRARAALGGENER